MEIEEIIFGTYGINFIRITLVKIKLINQK